MNIIPWRRRESLPHSVFDVEDVWSHLLGRGNGDFTSHLPEVFRNRPMPALNIAETEDSFSITLDCPGLDEEDIQVETMGSQLVISGERRWEEENRGKEFRRVESQYGKFERTVQLPPNVRIALDRVDASYKKGILTITVPKLEKTPASKIPVHAG